MNGRFSGVEPDGPSRLYDRVVDVIAKLETQPDIGSMVSGDPMTRRILLHGFPYQIVYRLRPAEIVIVGVAHMKRRPGYWKKRS